MKTITQLKERVSHLENAYSGKHTVDLSYKQIANELATARVCILYLETSPRKEFVEGELRKLLDRKKTITKAFPTWAYNNRVPETKKYKAKYRNEMNYGGILRQIKTIKYLLDVQSGNR